jgi:hypothetical protein
VSSECRCGWFANAQAILSDYRRRGRNCGCALAPNLATITCAPEAKHEDLVRAEANGLAKNTVAVLADMSSFHSFKHQVPVRPEEGISD